MRREFPCKITNLNYTGLFAILYDVWETSTKAQQRNKNDFRQVRVLFFCIFFLCSVTKRRQVDFTECRISQSILNMNCQTKCRETHIGRCEAPLQWKWSFHFKLFSCVKICQKYIKPIILQINSLAFLSRKIFRFWWKNFNFS